MVVPEVGHDLQQLALAVDLPDQRHAFGFGDRQHAKVIVVGDRVVIGPELVRRFRERHEAAGGDEAVADAVVDRRRRELARDPCGPAFVVGRAEREERAVVGDREAERRARQPADVLTREGQRIGARRRRLVLGAAGAAGPAPREQWIELHAGAREQRAEKAPSRGNE